MSPVRGPAHKIEKFFQKIAPSLFYGAIFIPVIGPTGHGKSTFINHVLEPDAQKLAQVSHGLKSCTSQCDMYILKNTSHLKCDGWIGNRRLIFVDTPGLDDGDMSDAEVLNEIAKSLHFLYKKDVAVAGIVYMLPIYPGRMTATQRDNMDSFRRLYGQNNRIHIALATTRWGICPSVEMGEAREEELRNTIWGDMVQQHAMMLRLDNNVESARNLVDAVMERFKDMTDNICFSPLASTFRPHQKKPGVKERLIKWYQNFFRLS